MAYETTADEALHDKVLSIAKNLKYDWYQRGLASMVYNFFYKKLLVGETVKNEIISNKELTEELHKLIIRTFEKRKVHSRFIDNIWGADLADVQLISKFDKEFRFLLCVIGIYSKYEWLISLNEIWIDKANEMLQ